MGHNILDGRRLYCLLRVAMNRISMAFAEGEKRGPLDPRCGAPKELAE